MRYLLFIVCFITVNKIVAQDSLNCKCSVSFKLNYPKKALENNICGDVIVEMDNSEDCVLSNPVVKQGIGYGCDEEALRLTRLWINFTNQCIKKCNRRDKCAIRKITQTVSFKCEENE